MSTKSQNPHLPGFFSDLQNQLNHPHIGLTLLTVDIIYGLSLDARLLLEALEHLRVVVLPKVLQAQPDRLPLAILQGQIITVISKYKKQTFWSLSLDMTSVTVTQLAAYYGDFSFCHYCTHT